MTEHRVVCTQCGGINRLPAARDPAKAKCGKCKAILFDGHPADVGASDFERQIAVSTVPVLVDVWAPWCGPCRMMAPAYEEAARQLEPHVRLIKLNSDENQEVAGRLGIRGIPSLLLYAGGREIGRSAGAMAAGQIVQWTRNALAGKS